MAAAPLAAPLVSTRELTPPCSEVRRVGRQLGSAGKYVGLSGSTVREGEWSALWCYTTMVVEGTLRILLSHTVVNLKTREVEGAVSLTKIEVALLRYLVQRPGQVITREELLEEVWGYRSTNQTRAVANAIARLRPKIEWDAQAPRHLLTVRGVGYRFEGWQLLDAPHQPPSPATSPEVLCFGRARELEWLTSRLAESDGTVLHVTGAGGIGKSHLVSTALATTAGPREVVWCDTIRIDDTADLLRRVAGALGVRLPPRSDVTGWIACLGLALTSRDRTVVVLDGLRHPDLASVVLSRWREMAPDADFVVTTRIAGPQDHTALVLGPLDTTAGVALYRALATTHGGVTGPEDTDTIADLVERLDGLPLAIALAASWTTVLTPSQTLARLDARFALLRSRDPNALAHQRTLWQTLEDSWELLDPAVQRTLAGCSVFRGGFAAAAIEAIVPGAHLEHIAILRDHALIQCRDDAGTMRYELPQSVMEFAAAQLEASGRREALYTRHAAHYLACCQALEAAMGTAEELTALQGASDNLLAIVKRFAERSADTSIRAALLVWYLRHSRGQEIGAEVLFAAADDVVDPILCSRGLATRSRCRRSSGDRVRAQVDLERAAKLAHSSEDPGAMGFVALTRCRGAIQGRDLETAQISGVDAERLLEAAGDWRGRFMATERLARIAHLRGDQVTAGTLFRQAMRGLERAGPIRAAAAARSNLGHLLRDQGRHEEATECYQAVIEVCQALGAGLDEDNNRVDLANIWMLEGRYAEACATYARVSLAHRQRGAQRGAALAETNCGIVEVLQGNLEAGRACLARGQDWAEDAQMPDLVALAWGMRGYVAHRNGHLSSARGCYADAIRSCQSPRMDQYAGVFGVYLALLHAAAGAPVAAREALAEARERFGTPPDAEARALLVLAEGGSPVASGSWSVHLAAALVHG